MNTLFLNPINIKSVEFFERDEQSYLRVIYNDDSTNKHDINRSDAENVIQHLHEKMNVYLKLQSHYIENNSTNTSPSEQ